MVKFHAPDVMDDDEEEEKLIDQQHTKQTQDQTKKATTRTTSSPPLPTSAPPGDDDTHDTYDETQDMDDSLTPLDQHLIYDDDVEHDDGYEIVPAQSQSQSQSQTQPQHMHIPLPPLSQHLDIDARKLHLMAASFAQEQSTSTWNDPMHDISSTSTWDDPMLYRDIAWHQSLTRERVKAQQMDGIYDIKTQQMDGIYELNIQEEHVDVQPAEETIQPDITYRGPIRGHEFMVEAGVAATTSIPITPALPTYANIISSTTPLSSTFLASRDPSIIPFRSCRIGWGPGGVLCIPRGTSITIQHIHVDVMIQDEQHEIKDMNEKKQYLTTLLTTHLHHYQSLSSSSSSSDTNTIFTSLCDAYRTALQPYIQSTSPSRHDTHTIQGQIQHSYSVWSLIRALWSIQEGSISLSHVTNAARNTEYAENYARHAAVTRYLEQAVATDIEQEISRTSSSHHLLLLISGHQLTRACQTAITQGDLRLATLLSQLGEDVTLHTDLIAQLNEWTTQGIWECMDKQHQQLYALLSGQVTVQRDLPWLRAFAQHLWYGRPSSQNITIGHALQTYQHAVTQGEAKPPIPPYPHQTSSRALPTVPDTRYSLFQLYVTPTTRLAPLFTPTSHVPYPMDHSLSWHLYDTLRHGCIHDYTRIHHLYLNYVIQLEYMGMWQWAIYVVMSSKYLDGKYFFDRESIVRDILNRHIPSTSSSTSITHHDDMLGITLNDTADVYGDGKRMRRDDEDDMMMISTSQQQHQHDAEIERFLLQDVHIPHEWIASAHALRAQYDRNPHIEINYLIQSQQWNRAHTVLMTQLAPQWILTERTDTLLSLLTTLSSHSSTISSWSTGGDLLLSFFTLQSHIRTTLSTLVEPLSAHAYTELEEIRTKCMNLMIKMSKKEEQPVMEQVAWSELSARLTVYYNELNPQRFRIQSQVHVGQKQSSTSFPLPSTLSEDLRLDALQKQVTRLLTQYT